MSTTNNGVDYVSAPADYADLFKKYYTFVVTLVRRVGIAPSSTEDVASEILLRFMERDFLVKFDPTLVFVYDGRERPARFKQFLTKFVLSYVRGLRDKARAITEHEILICDTVVGDEQEQTWVDVYGEAEHGHEDLVLERVDEEAFVDMLRNYLSGVPRRSRADTCDLPKLFDHVVAQIRAYDEINIHALAKLHGIGDTAMHTWLWWLKENLAAALDRPVPAKRRQRSRGIS